MQRLALALHDRQARRKALPARAAAAAARRAARRPSARSADTIVVPAAAARRKPSPCAAMRSAALHLLRWRVKAARQAFMRARSARFSWRIRSGCLSRPAYSRWRRPRRQETMAEPHEPCGRRSRVVPTRCRWAPCIRGHGLGQGQLPCGSYRPPGRIARDAPRSPAWSGCLCRTRRKKSIAGKRVSRPGCTLIAQPSASEDIVAANPGPRRCDRARPRSLPRACAPAPAHAPARRAEHRAHARARPALARVRSRALAAFGLAAPAPSPRRSGSRVGLASVTPGHARDPAVSSAASPSAALSL